MNGSGVFAAGVQLFGSMVGLTNYVFEVTAIIRIVSIKRTCVLDDCGSTIVVRHIHHHDSVQRLERLLDILVPRSDM